jgi:phenylalanyl-tRNA synthetase beta chain
MDTIAAILRSLEFKVEVDGEAARVTAPDHRLDIGSGEIGVADLLEEVARIYGYQNIPETRLADELPIQRNNISLDQEEQVRDILVSLGLQEVVNYRMTSPEREARRLAPGVPPDDKPYLCLANPIASDRAVMRHSLLSSLFEVVERNAHLRQRIAVFEIGPVFIAGEEGILPDEIQQLAIALTGPRNLPSWQLVDSFPMDFYDLKGIFEALLQALHIEGVRYEPVHYPVFHPGKCARALLEDRQIGVLGEMHPQVREHYDLPATPLQAAWFDLHTLLDLIPERTAAQHVSVFPPVLEDLAVVVDENIPAERVESLIRQAGGKTVAAVRLFDVYHGDQIGAGQKSLAYSLTYQAAERTLSDKDVAQIRQRIVRRLEQELGAKLRS